MNKRVANEPLIKQGWLRALLFGIFYFLLIELGGRLFVFLIAKLKGNDSAGMESIEGGFFWLSVLIGLCTGVVAVFLFRRFVDRNSVESLGLSIRNFADPLAGLFIAVAILGTGSLILYFSKHLQWTDIIFNGKELFLDLGSLFLVAFYEELVFRGYILNNLMESMNKWTSLAISALIFTSFHLANPAVNFIPLVNIFLAGLLLGINYIYTKNLWFSIMFHLSWNFFQGPLLGFKVSGINFSTLLQTELKGDLLLTGGEFGFEGSIFDMALSIIAILLLYLVYEKKYQQSLPLNLSASRD
jgi:uncharacterized protein